MRFDVVVIGGGAAGLMCAIEAGKRKRAVAVLERNSAIGRKIRISGGGRCNFTNLYTTPENFISGNASFSKSALSRYTPGDFIRMVERHRIPYHEKTKGQLFCKRTADDVIQMLLSECSSAGVAIYKGCSVHDVQKSDEFVLATTAGEVRCHSLVVASGGLSIPQIGATGFGYDLARRFGLRVVERRPALVPLTFTGADRRLFESLSGVSLEAEVRCGEVLFRESMLFTHRGLSGPAILQISSYWRPNDYISIDLLPDVESERVSGADFAALLDRSLPKRLAHAWTNFYAPPKPPAQWSRKEFDAVSKRLHDWRLLPSGTEGYGKAEVTAGGVDTGELSSKTMESRRVANLYFIGEVVDVTGQLGGFNFQWAWASGFVAGQHV